MAVYVFGTGRIADYGTKNKSQLISDILDFIWSGKDRKLRIIAINQGMNKTQGINQKLSGYINEISASKGYHGLKRIGYKDIRAHCEDPMVAGLYGSVAKEVMKELHYAKNHMDDATDCFEKIGYCMQMLGFGSVVFVFLPILLVSKILQIAFPWIIIGYLGYNDLLFNGKIDLFQMVMMGVYVGMQLLVLFLGIHVMRIQWFLWHIEPGTTYAYWSGGIKNVRAAEGWYQRVCWYPRCEEIVMRVMGHDIGSIIMEYVRNIHVEENELMRHLL